MKLALEVITNIEHNGVEELVDASSELVGELEWLLEKVKFGDTVPGLLGKPIATEAA